MLRKTPCRGSADARADLLGLQVSYTAQAGQSAPPEISVQGRPGAGLKVIAQMPFERADRVFALRLPDWAECRVRGVKPYTGISVEHPVSPSFGVSEFGLERPTINAPVDDLGRIVLSCGGCHP